MKHLYLSLFIIASICLHAGTIVFKGEIKEIPKKAHTHLYFLAHAGGNTIMLDSLKLDAKGRFSFASKMDLEAGLYYLSLDKLNLKPIILSPSEPNVEINSSYESWNKGEVSILNSKENEGYTVLNKLLNAHNEGINDFRSKINISKVDSFYNREVEAAEDHISFRTSQLNQQLFGLQKEYKGTYIGDVLSMMYIVPQMSEYPSVAQHYDNTPSFLHDHYWDFTNFKDPRVLNAPMFLAKLNEYSVNFADFNGLRAQGSIDKLLVRALENELVFDYCIRYLFRLFSEENMDEQMVYILSNYIDKEGVGLLQSTTQYVNTFRQSLRGLRVQDFISKTSSGVEVRLSEVLAKHKACLLYFWSSTHKASTELNKDLKEIRKAVGTDNLGIMGVSFETDGIQWKNTVDALGLDWANVSDLKGGNSPLIQQFNVKQLPNLLLLRSDGTIIMRNPDLKKMVAVLLEAFNNQ